MTEFLKFIILNHVVVRRKDHQLDSGLLLRPFVLYLFYLTPRANFQRLLIYTPFFMFNALWLAAFFYSTLLFLIRILFLIYAHFFRKAVKAKHELDVCFFILNISFYEIQGTMRLTC